MRRALVLVILIAIAMSVRSSAQTATTGRFVPGEILVKFRPGAAADTRGAAHRAAGATLVDESVAATVITALGPISTHPSEVWLLQGFPAVCADARFDMAAAITITLSLIAVLNLNFLGLLICAP